MAYQMLNSSSRKPRLAYAFRIALFVLCISFMLVCWQIFRSESSAGFGSSSHKTFDKQAFKACPYAADLIPRLRRAQKLVNKRWRDPTKQPIDQWAALAPAFNESLRAFDNLPPMFNISTGDEMKYFVEFVDPNSPCQHITVGVGGSWTVEREIRKKYPQCSLVGVDPSITNKPIVESMPDSIFVHTAIGAKDGAEVSSLLNETDPHALYVDVPIRQTAFSKFLWDYVRDAKTSVVDFMTLDVEGAEFVLLPELHIELPTICQINFELHWREKFYGVSAEQFEASMEAMFEEGNWIMLHADPLTERQPRLFMFNSADYRCIEKFVCGAKR